MAKTINSKAVLLNGYDNLANAIIIQAVMDYRVALKMSRAGSKSSNPDFSCVRLEKFFLSDWFMVLTDLDGKVLMKSVQKEVFKDDY